MTNLGFITCYVDKIGLKILLLLLHQSPLPPPHRPEIMGMHYHAQFKGNFLALISLYVLNQNP